MQYPIAIFLLAVSLVLQGCGSPEKGADDSATKQASPAAEQVAKATPVESWYKVESDPKSASPVYKSPADKRDYRYLVLDNGMKVLLISDPDADKAAASISVNIGSFENPANREGLAHFLEHMLFLGTDKYPEPGEYQSYLSEHGGTFNAYTSLEETNYFFDVDASYLSQVLDRFSRFFVAPLFNEEYADRERHAVDSEYQLKIKDDSRREWDVLRELSNPGHPFSKFAVGNLDTLKNSDDDPVRQDLIDFYKQYYSASEMNLVVLGTESLDDLDGMVRSRFAQVPSHKVELEKKYTPLFKEKLPIEVKIQPEKEIRALSFNFPMPSLMDDWKIKPAEFLGHLLGHEGHGSLLSVLKARGLAEGLSSGQVFDSRHGSLFSVRIQLTPGGVSRQDEVTREFFQWLDMVKGQGLEKWRYDEVAKMSQIEFQFAEKHHAMGYVSSLSTSMQYYPPKEILRGDYEFAPFDKPRLEQLVGYLTPDNVAMVLTAPGVKTDRKTALYDAPYSVTSLKASDLALTAADNELKLPEKNPYIPDNLSLINENSGVKVPQPLGDSRNMWFFGNNTFGTPKSYFESRLTLPGDPDLDQEVAREFILALVDDELSAEVYPAMLAGLGFSLDPWDRGVRITISGYNEKQSLLLERILKVLKNPSWEPERVARVRATMVRGWKNTAKDWPLKQLFNRFPSLVKEDWPAADKARALAALDIDKIKQVHTAMISGAEGRFYGAGNLTGDDLEKLAFQVTDALGLVADTAEVPVDIRNLKESEPLFSSRFYVDHNDSAAVLYLQGEADNLQERATFGLLNVMVSAPFYTSLRTDKQLGYAVGNSIAPLLRVPGLLFYVQSPKVDADQLRTEMNRFFDNFASTVDGLTEADLDRYRQSVLASVEEKPKNLNELAQRHLESLNLGYQEFDFRDRLAEALKAVTLDQFKASFTRVMLDDRTGFWVLTSTDKSVGEGQGIPGDILEQSFSYSY